MNIKVNHKDLLLQNCRKIDIQPIFAHVFKEKDKYWKLF